LESSRCSCSLCSSQGAVRYDERWRVTARCCHAAPADPRREQAKAPRKGDSAPFLQNGIVMTAEPRLGLPTLETTHRGALRRDKPNSQ